MIKICSLCKLEKSRSSFSKQSAAGDGLRSECKACQSKYNAKYTKKNKAKRAKYNDEHKERIAKRQAKYNAEHTGQYYTAHKKKRAEYKIKYDAEHRPDPAFKIGRAHV